MGSLHGRSTMGDEIVITFSLLGTWIFDDFKENNKAGPYICVF